MTYYIHPPSIITQFLFVLHPEVVWAASEGGADYPPGFYHAIERRITYISRNYHAILVRFTSGDDVGVSKARAICYVVRRIIPVQATLELIALRRGGSNLDSYRQWFHRKSTYSK